MTTEPNLPLRARVAELMGYTNIHWGVSGCLPGVKGVLSLPPYDTSRDAIAEAEDALLTTDDLELAYVLALRDVMQTRQFRKVVRATAAQRCEALLAALGKEVEG